MRRNLDSLIGFCGACHDRAPAVVLTVSSVTVVGCVRVTPFFIL
jgi:hypothetical protein